MVLGQFRGTVLATEKTSGLPHPDLYSGLGGLLGQSLSVADDMDERCMIWQSKKMVDPT